MTSQRFNLRRLTRTTLAGGLLLSLLAIQNAFAQVTLNFVNADIEQVARAIGAATNKTIIVDPRVKGQLNLVSEQPVPEDQALKIMQSALRAQGFALLQDHGVLKVVPEADAKLQGVPTYIGNQPQARGDQVITQVFQLRNESANNLLPVLRPLISPNNQIAAYSSNNTLVVTDYADNVRRIAQIISGVDNVAGSEVAMVPLKNASAVDLAAQLGKLLDPGAVGGTDATLRVTVTPDTRTNSLLLRASSSARLAAAKALIAKLDAPTSMPGNIHVVPLRNADAVQLAKTLRSILGQGGSAGQPGASGSGTSFNPSSTNGGTGTAGMPPLPSGSSLGTQSNNPMGGGGSSSQSKDTGFGDKEQKDDQGGQGGVVQADSATNSLIITAAEPVYLNLRNVIEELDARRAQVYIEALIVELQASTAANLGIQWQGALLSGSGNNILYGGTNFATGTSQGIVNLTATGNALAQNPSALASATNLLNNGLNIGLLHKFGNVVGLGGLLQALSTTSDANVLSTPNLITLDNQEAKIVVGQNVPVVTGSYATPTANTGTSVTAFNTFDREDVGITLHVKPQITDGGVLKLQIYTENSTVDATSINNPGGVTINKRSIQSVVLADDGQIIVLGGLMQDNYANGNSKVPFLGNLPLIGNLFRAENKARTKTNLMVFLRPVIVRDSRTSEALSLNRYDYLRNVQGGYQSDNRVEKDDNVPMLPPVPNSPNQGGGAPVALDWGQMERQIPPNNGSNGSDRGAPGNPGAPGALGTPGNSGNAAPNGRVDSAVNGYTAPSDGKAPSATPWASPSTPANTGAADGFASPGVRP